MGTICILLGLIILLAFTGAGFFLTNEILSNPTYVSLFSLSDTTSVYCMIVGVCAFIGLLICLSLVMHGLTYNRVNKIYSMIRRHH